MVARNLRVYLVLDPDEAEAVLFLLSKPPRGPKLQRIVKRLHEAMERARSKGAKIGNLERR